jgi:hypothetical protein
MGALRIKISELAREYESLRKTMSPGDERTRQLEIVVTKMRTFALAAYPLLHELTRSASEGERLAAIVMLQVRPNPSYLHWLSRRVVEEKPFSGYHAAVGLLVAARTLDASSRSELERAIQTAKSSLDTKRETDRYRTLAQAEAEMTPSTHAEG